MTTELKVFENANIPTPEALIGALDNLKDSYACGGGTVILKYDKRGNWTFGANATLVEEDSLWAVNPFSFTHGFVAWGGDMTPDAGKLLGEVICKMTEPKPNPGEAPENAPLGWQEQIGFNLKCMEGEDAGMEAHFCTQSKGGIRSLGKLIGEISAQARREPSRPIPVVKLVGYDPKNSETFYDHKNKSYGRVLVPVFEVLDWIGGGQPASAPQIQEPEPEIITEEVEVEQAEDAPVRRRRRMA